MASTSKKKEHQAPSVFGKSLDCLKDCCLSMREMFKIFAGLEKELPVELPPSLYLVELKRSHQERQALLKRNQVLEKKKEFKGELEVIPNVIVFQNWFIDHSVSVKFTISNRLKNPLDVNVSCEPSPHFSIASQTTTRHFKLANGITTPFSVIFLPDAWRDYKHQITITTSFSTIIIPIIAVGPRPILDFPDKVDFGETPVKVFIKRVLTISNVGDSQAAASLITDSPFGVSPKTVCIQPSQSCALEVVFCSKNPGLFFGTLKIAYDNGDEMVVKMVAIAGNAQVWLETSLNEFADTFIGTKIENGIKIYNQTDHVLSFKWLKHPSPVDDINVVLNMQTIDASIQPVTTGVTVDYYASGHNHQIIKDRVHLDGAKQIQRGEQYFKHSNFDLMPMVGEVNPHSEKRITLVFAPVETIKYSTTAYCDVEGADRRFPLELVGTGIGPDIHVNIDVIDFDLIFLKLEHSYELLFTNLSLIKGKIKFREPKLTYGGTLTAYPEQLDLDPSVSKIVNIRFVSGTIGSFVEEMFFDVIGSNKAIRVIIKGKIVTPLVTFDRTYVDFGRVAFGFPISQTLRIDNKSSIPATYKAVVPGDGNVQSMPVWTYGDKLSSLRMEYPKMADGERPQEFTITPTSGVLIPHGTIYLEITLTPTTARECNTTLQIWLRDIEYEELTIPIHFIACQASLTALPPIILHRYAFLGFQYSFDLTLENEGETPLFYFSDPPVDDDDTESGISYYLTEDSGIINGNSTARLTLHLTVSKLGKHEESVDINIFGHSKPIQVSTIVAYGIGPSVTAEPYSLVWENQPIGISSSKELTLHNICPISAQWELKIKMDYSGGYCDPKLWTLSQDRGVLEPYDEIVIDVTVCLTDGGRIEAELALEVTNAVGTKIKLIGQGSGSSIQFEPPLMDSWDFGNVFINELFTFPISVKNIGTLHHRLIITHKKLKSSDMTTNNKGTRLPLQFTPDRIDLDGCEEKNMQIILQKDMVGLCSKEFYLYATINRKGKRKLIGQCTLKANFIFPLLVVDPRVVHLYFRLENLTMELPTYVTADTRVWTTTLMPIETVATVKPPFSLVSKDGSLSSKLVFPVTKEATVTKIRLDSVDLNEEEMKKINGLLTFTVMHKYKTRVTIKAAVLFPYLSMNESKVHLGSSEPYVALYSTLQLKNKGNLPISFRWKLVADSFRYIDVMCPELTLILETEEMKKAMTKLDVLPKWEPKENEYGTTEDTEPVNSTQIAPRFGVLSVLKKALDADQLKARPSPIKNDILKINAHAISTALVPLLNDTLLLALIADEKCNLPPLPMRDDKAWVGHHHQGSTNVLRTETRKLLESLNELWITFVEDNDVMAYLGTDLDLVPSYGTLPSQYELITNTFVEPDRLGVFVGDAVCEVENGLSETATFTGACGPPFYRLEPEIIDFGVRKFCELWTTTFKIINIGWTSFYYEINIMWKDHLLEYSMRPRCFSIQPASRLIESGNEVEVKVILYPAITGPFKKYFSLLVGNCPPRQVEIKGFASVPQILINCPWNEYNSVPEEINYSAIGRQLCNEWFCPMISGSIDLSSPVMRTVTDFYDQHICLEMPPPASYGQDFLYPFEEGWVIVTANVCETNYIPNVARQNFVPTSADVTLAVERELCHDYYHYLKPKMLRHMMRHYAGEIEKEKPFPYFTLPGYKMDLGPVVIGKEKHYDLEILNPGPLDVHLRVRLPNKLHLARKGITFNGIDDDAYLHAGQSLTLRCDAIPSHKLFKNLNADCLIQFVFCIEIACGGKIPIQFTTAITYPYLNIKKKIVFGKLKCGQKRMVHFLIKNSGLVPVSWECHQRNVKKRPVKDIIEGPNEVESPFSFSPTEGHLDPLSYQFMVVEFLPTIGGKFERVLEFQILNREQPQLVRLVGEAVEPKVDIYFDDMNFVSVVPFALTTFKDLTAINNTDVPLEVFFPEYDYDICEEEKIFSILCHYYGVPNMFVPFWCYDTSMTSDLKNIYYQKLGSLAEAYYQSVREKSRSREPTLSKKSKRTMSRTSEPESRQADDLPPKTKKAKSKKKARASVLESKNKLDDLAKSDKHTREEEIKEMFIIEPTLDEKISTYLNYLHTNPDVSRRDLFQPLEEPGAPTELEGPNKLIFFGGAPNTNHKYWAKYTAKQTKLLYMTIDELIIYAASSTQFGPAALVRKTVNDVYCNVVMGLDPTIHPLIDQFDPLSDVNDPLLDLLTKVAAIERLIEESKEEARKAKEESDQVPWKRRPAPKRDKRSKTPGKRQSKSPASKRPSKSPGRKSKAGGSRKSKAGGARKSKAGGPRKSKTGASRRQSAASKKSNASRKSPKMGDAVLDKIKKSTPAAHLKLDLEKPVIEDLPVDLLFDLIKYHYMTEFEFIIKEDTISSLLFYINTPGVVLDYMRGFFIRDSVLAMTTVLKAIFDRRFDLRCIDLNSSFAFHQTIMENRQKAEEKRRAEEILRKLHEIDKMDGFQFRELDEETKIFYIEQVKKRDEAISNLALVGIPIYQSDKKKSFGVVTPSSNQTTTASSTDQPSKSPGGTPITLKSGTANTDPNDANLRKTSSTLKIGAYVSRIGGNPFEKNSFDEEAYLLYYTFEKEMQSIRHILEHWDSKNPFWMEETKKVEEQAKKPKKKPKADDSKGKDKGSTDSIPGWRRKESIGNQKNVGIPHYVLHTVPWGEEKDLQPLMNYLLTKPEFKAAPVVKKPWDDVQEPEPVTYFWLMQPLYGISGEDEEFTGLKSTVEYPGEATTTNELGTGRRTSGGSSMKRGSHITTKESESTIRTGEIQSLNDDHEEDIEHKEENEEQELTRKHENADPLMVGLLHTSNLANEQRILEQLHNGLFRIDPELQTDLKNQMIEILYPSGNKLSDDHTSPRSKAQAKGTISKTKKSHATGFSLQRIPAEEDVEETEKVTIPELVEVDQFHIYGVSLAVGAETSGPGVRVLLNPGESATWRVTCSTRQCGTFERKFLMEVGGWQKSLVPITCHVTSGIPSFNMDPHVIYCSVSEKFPPDQYPAYILDTKCFDFGPVISSKCQNDPRIFQVGTEFKIVNDSGVVIEELSFTSDDYEPTRQFTLEPAELKNIMPGEVRIVNCYAHPIADGSQEARFWYYIKNNPIIWFLQFKCLGLGGKISYTAEEFTDNKVLLLRKVMRTLRLHNVGTGLYWEIVNVAELASHKVRLNHTKGNLRKGEVSEVDVGYRPLQPGVLSVKLKLAVYNWGKIGNPIQMEDIPFSVEGVDIAVTILYRWKSVNHGVFISKDHLDCGRVNVGEMVSRSFIIISGCHDEFNFEIVNRKNWHCDVQCLPESGKLTQYGKKIRVDVNVLVTYPVTLKKEPVMDLKLTYVDNEEDDLVAMIPIPLSIYCKSSQFSFYPSPELDFGVVEVNSFQERKIVFENLGDAPLELALMTTTQLEVLVNQIEEAKREEKEFLRDKRKEREKTPKSTIITQGSQKMSKPASKADSKASKASPKGAAISKAAPRASKVQRKSKVAKKSKVASRVSKVASRASKVASRVSKKVSRASKLTSKTPIQRQSGRVSRKKSRMKSELSRQRHDRLWFIDKCPFEIGAFKLSTNGITIPPFGQDFVTVSCTLETLGQTEETVVICSPDIIRDHPEKGVFYQMRAVSAVPNVDFSSPQIMYPDMTIVSNQSHIDVSEGEPLGIFSEDSNTITFYNVALGQRVYRTVVLTNVGFIDAAVQVCIEEVPSDVNKENAFGFSEDLTKRETVIYTQKFGHESFRLYFSPSALQMVRGVMKFNLITNVPDYTLTHEVFLEGLGELPEISVISPYMTDEIMMATIDFGSCVLNFPQTKHLIFQNVGKIVCTVLVERKDDIVEQSAFTLKVNNDVRKKYLRSPDPNDLGRTTKFFVPRGHQVELEVLFTPKSAKEIYYAVLALHTVYNPYVIKTVALVGSGSSDWLSLHGVPLKGLKEEQEKEEKTKKMGKGRQSTGGRQSVASKRKSMTGQKKDIPPTPPPEKSKSPPVIVGPYNEIDFGVVSAGVVHSFSFDLINSSTEPCRFSWESHPNVRIIPGEGHILPKISKRCYAIFTSEEPVELPLEAIKCEAYPIVYENSYDIQTSQWDSEQKTVQWISHLDNVTEVSTKEFLKKREFPLPEPPHKKSDLGEEKTMILYVKGSCQMPDVTLSAESVNMNTAFLYQKEETVIDVKNTSSVPVEFTWSIKTTNVAGVSELFGRNPVVSTGPLGEGEYPGILPGGFDTLVTPRAPQKKLPQRPGYIYKPTAINGPIALRSGGNVKISIESSTATMPVSLDPAFYPSVFFVTPFQGMIPPHESASFKFTFIPPEALKYFADATLRIKGLPEPKVLSLSGLGQMSSCHIEITPSDYLTAGRRIPHIVPGYDYDPNTTVIEMRVMGIGIIYRKRFTVMNPTEGNYHFQWRLEHSATDSESEDIKSRNAPFLCCTKFGLLPSKQKQEMLFEFRPHRAGTTESYWTLEIQELQLRHAVLIVGIVTEPEVVIKPHILLLRPTLKGVKSYGEVSIENNEDVPITFSIDPETLTCGDDGNCLEAQPSKGAVNPHEFQMVRFTHVPIRAGEETFIVKCDIKRKAEPLKLTVRTTCYQVEMTIKYKYQNETGTLYSHFPNTINLGRLYERIPCNVEFVFTNIGIAPWYFHCEPDKIANESHELKMSLSVAAGLVLSKDSKTVSLSIVATKKNTFNKIPFSIKITKGPEFNILFSGTASMPEYTLSFREYDFGPKILLNKYDKEAYCVELLITNMDDTSIVLTKTSVDPDFLNVDLLSCVIQPRSRIQVPVSFIPLTAGIRESTVRLVFNDVTEETVHIKAEGVTLDILLMNGKDEIIDLGTVEVNKTVRREEEIRNNTQCTVPVWLDISDANEFIATVTPKILEMRPNSSAKFGVSLTPKKRGALYNGDVTLHHADYKIPLLSMTCLGGGYDISLNRQHVPFPAVIIGSSVVEHVCLVNQGEYPARYEWKMDSQVRQLFNIAPQKGNSNPGSFIPFEITFYPTKLFKSITTEVSCLLSNGQTLAMKLTGACLELPPSKEVIEFKTPVRKELMNTILLENKTYTPWTLFPVLSGKYYSGEDRVEIDPNGKLDYEVRYYPLLSTTEDKKHTGSVFFAFPDGRCMLYALQGETMPPEGASTILWTVTAKEETPKSLEVENWLYEPQRMKVTFSRTDRGNPEMFIIQGPEFIDLPPKCVKPYEVNLYAIQEGVSNWKIEMKNERLNEYLWYSLTLNVRGCKILQKFTMETNLRVPVVKTLIIENPLAKPASVTFKSPAPTLSMLNASPVVIQPNELLMIELEYLPLTFPYEFTEQECTLYGEEADNEVFSEEHRLEFKSPQLGSFFFDVVLVAHPVLPEPPIYVEAHVSSPAVFGIPIKVFSSNRVTFDFKSSFQDIWLLNDGMERLPDKQNLLAKCIYSPSQLGKFNCQLTFFSPETGTYSFPVVATGLSPKPMGPILFETGQSKSIAFQNIFPDNQSFSVRRSNTAFELDNESFTLDPNEVRLITATMFWAHNKQSGDDVIEPYPIATQLTIMPESPPRPGIVWVFYLKGTNKEVSEIIEGAEDSEGD